MVARLADPCDRTSPARSAPCAAAALPAPTPGLAQDLPSRTHFWRGASGRRHVFSVYGLLECPPLPPVTYVLVRRDADGRRHRLGTGTVAAAHAPQNLAALRYRAACLGANEVHVAASGAEASARAALAAEFDV